jgi:hypothetical protein
VLAAGESTSLTSPAVAIPTAAATLAATKITFVFIIVSSKGPDWGRPSPLLPHKDLYSTILLGDDPPQGRCDTHSMGKITLSIFKVNRKCHARRTLF